jgi:hypothetical protein
MLRYHCGHCLADLGEVVAGEEEPECPEHPGGDVQIAEVGDDPVDS